MFRGLTCLLVSGVVSLAACGDDGTSPEDELTVEAALTVEEVQFVADRIDATLAGVLDDFFDSSGGDPTGAPARTHGPVVWTRTFERSRPCHDRGTLTVAGTGKSVWNPEAVTYDVESSGTKTRTNCAYTRDGVVITTIGNPSWTERLTSTTDRNLAPTYVGGFDWTKSSEPASRPTSLPGRPTRREHGTLTDVVRERPASENLARLRGRVPRKRGRSSDG